MASGQLEAPDYLQAVEVIQSESLEALIGNPELPYAESAKYGAKAKSIAKCQNKFTCPKTGQEILLMPHIHLCMANSNNTLQAMTGGMV